MAIPILKCVGSPADIYVEVIDLCEDLTSLAAQDTEASNTPDGLFKDACQ